MVKISKGTPSTGRSAMSLPSNPSKKWYDINFKVPLEFRREFKQRAARHDMSMVELLHAAYRLWVETNDPELPAMPTIKDYK